MVAVWPDGAEREHAIAGRTTVSLRPMHWSTEMRLDATYVARRSTTWVSAPYMLRAASKIELEEGRTEEEGVTEEEEAENAEVVEEAEDEDKDDDEDETSSLSPLIIARATYNTTRTCSKWQSSLMILDASDSLAIPSTARMTRSTTNVRVACPATITRSFSLYSSCSLLLPPPLPPLPPPPPSSSSTQLGSPSLHPSPRRACATDMAGRRSTFAAKSDFEHKALTSSGGAGALIECGCVTLSAVCPVPDTARCMPSSWYTCLLNLACRI